MSKKFLAIILAIAVLFGVFVLSACDQDVEEEEILSLRQQAFVDAVEAIETPITLDSRGAIDAAERAYVSLDEYERDSKTVAYYRSVLNGYQSDYTALKQGSGSDNGGKEDDKPVDEQQTLVASFIKAVEDLPALQELTLDDRSAINSAIALYNRLNATSKQNEEVISAYSTLVQADSRVAELEAIANQQAWAKMAEEFIEEVEQLGEVTLELGYTLEDLLYQYDKFPDGVKNADGVAEAKAALDAKYEEYKQIRDDNDVQEFLSAVDAIGEVTLKSEGAILRAESIYRYMSDNAKANSDAVEAYQTLVATRAKYNQLFQVAEAERIAHFIEAVSKLRTDVENVDLSWYDALHEAQDAYSALSYDSMFLPEVEQAFERMDAVQRAFDKKGYGKLPNFSINVLYSGDAVPFIVLQSFVENVAPIREFYGVKTNAELQQHAILYLDVYVDGVYVTKTAIDMNKLVNGFILQNVDTLLKGLSADNPEIVSGANFSFAVHIEDRNGINVPTAKTAVSATKNYTW